MWKKYFLTPEAANIGWIMQESDRNRKYGLITGDSLNKDLPKGGGGAPFL
jgi:hypothetical protein